MNINPQALINMAIQRNPALKNNANASAMINAVLNNDEKTGVELANNLLKTYGVKREDGIEQAKSYFGVR